MGTVVSLRDPSSPALFGAPEAVARKTYLITGATGGLGRVICHHMACSSPANFILAARDEQRLSDLAGDLRQHPGLFSYHPFDYAQRTTIEQLAQACSVGIDGVVLMTPRIPKTNECLPDPEFQAMVYRDCLIHPNYLIKKLLPSMRGEAHAKFVILSGISSVQVLSHYALNGAIRAAWLAQAKTLAHKYGPQGIHFNTLSLGGVMTDTYTETLRKKAKGLGRSFEAQMVEEVANVPLRKYADPNEVAALVALLLSDGANHLTGVNLIADGGFTRTY